MCVPMVEVTLEYVSDRISNFTGRDWVFQKVYDWLSNPHASRYFLLTGEPGSGKTAIVERHTQFFYDYIQLA
jgi:ATP-dependent Clp protease ATP-binding subunit ClpA